MKASALIGIAAALMVVSALLGRGHYKLDKRGRAISAGVGPQT